MDQKVIIAIAGSIVLVFLAAMQMGGSETVPSEIVDQNLITSQRNAEFNANKFRNERFPEAVRVLMDSDSTISADCRFGDGWASGALEMPDGKELGIKCQTNGSGKGFSGCLTKEDFVTKTYAELDGTCDNTITALPKFK